MARTRLSTGRKVRRPRSQGTKRRRRSSVGTRRRSSKRPKNHSLGDALNSYSSGFWGDIGYGSDTGGALASVDRRRGRRRRSRTKRAGTPRRKRRSSSRRR